MINLTRENYHDDTTMLSASRIKQVLDCEAAFLWAEDADKEVFKEGRYFETVLCDEDVEAFKEMNPDMISSRGATKGELKANFKKVEFAIEAVRRQPLFMNIIRNADKQVILTGEILGEPFKGMVDLMLPKARSIYDLKAMANFNRAWNGSYYADWWELYRYDVQLWIYRELARQAGMVTDRSQYGLIAATKQENSDVAGIAFSEETMALAEKKVHQAIYRIQALRAGDTPAWCGKCPYCLEHKKIEYFEVV